MEMVLPLLLEDFNLLRLEELLLGKTLPMMKVYICTKSARMD